MANLYSWDHTVSKDHAPRVATPIATTTATTISGPLSDEEFAKAIAAAKAAEAAKTKSSGLLKTEAHTAFFAYFLRTPIHRGYASLDTSRMTILYFALSALDVLGALERVVDATQRTRILDWVYAQQVVPNDATPSVTTRHLPAMARAGFRGGGHTGRNAPEDHAHIAMTYSALCILKILGDDLTRVQRRGIIGSLRFLQRPNGSFTPIPQGGESDVRFTFCAAAISFLLDDFSGFDTALAARYIQGCQSYDGGIALFPGSEGHGGSTYVSLASLRLMRMPLVDVLDVAALRRWLVLGQGSGFVGRPNKPPDTCYSFWMGASLHMLGDYETYATSQGNRDFNLSCQGRKGGFSKVPDSMQEILHSYYALAGLSLMGKDTLRTLDPMLGITVRARDA